ncbi:MAG TPA: hypothetical protein VGZ93_04630 [Candidatus Methylacidiphilales bacterium]|nr:hypothetical protein [Candidatus Methylacidiphilales bacterium]
MTDDKVVSVHAIHSKRAGAQVERARTGNFSRINRRSIGAHNQIPRDSLITRKIHRNGAGNHPSVHSHVESASPGKIQIEDPVGNAGLLKITADKIALNVFIGRSVDRNCRRTARSHAKIGGRDEKSGENMRRVGGTRHRVGTFYINPIRWIIEIIIGTHVGPIGVAKSHRPKTRNRAKKNRPQQKFHFARKLLKTFN